MKKIKTLVSILILLPVATLLLGCQAIVNPAKARKILKDSIQSAREKSKK